MAQLRRGEGEQLSDGVARCEVVIQADFAPAGTRWQIDIAHLTAGLAVWDYCQQSAERIFAGVSGDPVIDTIVEALRNAAPDGLSRTHIRDMFGRHESGARIDAALGELLRSGKARCELLPTGGRPTETWFTTCDKSDQSDQRGANGRAA